MNNLARTGIRPEDKKRLTIAVAAVAVVVIIVVAVVLSGRPKTMYKLAADSITRISITGGANLRLERKNGEWLITDPVSWPVGDERLEQILAFVTAPKGHKAGKAGADLSKYGLDNPLAQVTVEAGSERVAILIGSRVPRKAAHYVKLADGSLVWEVSEADVAFFAQSELTYLSRHVGKFGKDVVSLQIVRGDETIALRRQDDGRWHVLQPFQDIGDQAVIQELLDYLSSLYIRDYIDNPGALDQYGLAEPAARVIAVTEDGDRVEVSFGDVAGLGVRYAKNADFGSVVTLTGVRFLPLYIEAKDVVKQTLLDFQVDDVVGLRIRNEYGEDLQFKKINGIWYVHPDTEDQAMAFNVNALLNALLDIRIQGVEVGMEGIDDEELDSSRFDVELANGQRLWLRIFLPSEGIGEGLVQVSDTNRPHYYRILEFGSMLLARRIEAVSTSIIDLPVEEATLIQIMTPEIVEATTRGTPQPLEYRLDVANGVWKSGRDVYFGVEEFIQSFLDIVVETMVPEEAGVDYGFDPAKGGRWYYLATDRDNVRLEIGGEASSDGSVRYLRVSELPGIFLAEVGSLENVEKVHARMHTSLLDVDVERLARVEVYRNGEEYVVEKSGGNWVNIEASAVQTLVDQVKTVTVQSAALDVDPADCKFYPDSVGVQLLFVYDDGSYDRLDLGDRIQQGVVGWFASYVYYLRGSGETVYLAADSVGRNLTTAINNFVNQIK